MFSSLLELLRPSSNESMQVTLVLRRWAETPVHGISMIPTWRHSVVHGAQNRHTSEPILLLNLSSPRLFVEGILLVTTRTSFCRLQPGSNGRSGSTHASILLQASLKRFKSHPRSTLNVVTTHSKHRRGLDVDAIIIEEEHVSIWDLTRFLDVLQTATGQCRQHAADSPGDVRVRVSRLSAKTCWPYQWPHNDVQHAHCMCQTIEGATPQILPSMKVVTGCPHGTRMAACRLRWQLWTMCSVALGLSR